MDWKKIFRDYFIFTRKDRVAIIVLVALIVLVLLVPKLFKQPRNSRFAGPDTAWISAIQRLEQRDSGKVQNEDNGNETYTHRYSNPGNSRSAEIPSQLFFFNPNTLSAAEWTKLGVRPTTIQIIQHYLAKGGHFKKPEDLQRVYGLQPAQYEKLAPYVRISHDSAPSRQPYEQTTAYEKQISKPSSFHYSAIDINTADTNAFIALPGIGSKLASRITTFRDKLGGFYSIDQIGETFGLQDSVFQKIKIYLQLNNPVVKKININTATIDELKTHPYIRWSLGNSIIAYRNEHGPFAKKEDLKNVMAMTDDVYNKISPYLIVQ